jgi:hypothetical protein
LCHIIVPNRPLRFVGSGLYLLLWLGDGFITLRKCQVIIREHAKQAGGHAVCGLSAIQAFFGFRSIVWNWRHQRCSWPLWRLIIHLAPVEILNGDVGRSPLIADRHLAENAS